MPDKVTIVRPDGTLLDATPEQAQRLQLLGYREQTPEENTAAVTAQSKADYYGSGDQRLAALGEGVQAGLSFGATDYLFGDDETKQRATYNPGTRLAGEAIGALAPLILTSGESLAASAGGSVGEAGILSQAARTAEFAPTSLLSRGAGAATAGLEGGLSRAVVQGSLEGSVYGAAGAADHAWLDGEPITAEAVLHGLGWGAVLGGGLGALGEGLTKLGEGAAAREAASEALRTPTKAGPGDLNNVAGPSFDSVSREVTSYRTQLSQATEAADATVKGLLERDLPLDLGPVQRDLAMEAKEGALKSYEKIMKLSEAGKADAALEEIKSFNQNAEKFARAANSPELFESSVPDYNTIRSHEAKTDSFMEKTVRARDIADRGYYEPPGGNTDQVRVQQARDIFAPGGEGQREPIDLNVTPSGKVTVTGGRHRLAAAVEANAPIKVKWSTGTEPAESDVFQGGGAPPAGPVRAGGALKQIVELQRIGKELSKFPTSVEQFASMPAAKAERVFAAIEAGKSAAISSDALHGAVQEMSSSLGIQAEKSSLRDAWVAAKKMYKEGTSTAKPKAPAAEEGHVSFGRKMLGYALGGKAYAAVRATGAGRGAAIGAYSAVKAAVTRPGAGTAELGSIRNAVVGRVRSAAANYLPGAGAAVSKSIPVAPLATSLIDGRMDSDTKDMRELAARRAREVVDLGPTIKDFLFRQLQTMNTAQPELAPAIHQAALGSFAALQAMIPRDPGAVDKLKPLWKPSDVHAVVMAKQLEVFHDPVGVAEQMLSSGQFDPIQTKALRELAPNIWADMRVNLLQRITDPKVRDKLSYQEQIGLSTMLDVPLHSSMDPKYISMSQQIFQDRNQPLKANPRMGQGGPGTMPDPQDNINSTASQRVTSR